MGFFLNQRGYDRENRFDFYADKVVRVGGDFEGSGSRSMKVQLEKVGDELFQVLEKPLQRENR